MDRDLSDAGRIELYFFFLCVCSLDKGTPRLDEGGIGTPFSNNARNLTISCQSIKHDINLSPTLPRLSRLCREVHSLALREGSSRELL